MVDVNANVKAVLNGEIRIRRFNAEEQSGSSQPADGFPWRCILQAESELAEIARGGIRQGDIAPSLRTIPPYRYLTEVSQDLPLAFDDLLAELGTYQDRGRESIVCDSGDGYVRKLRPMRPSILSGYMAPLANIVYHNRIFPQDRYVLENIFCRGDDYFMVLKQERIDILLDGNGYPIKPTAAQIRAAIQHLDVTLYEYSGGYVEEDDDSTESSSRIDEDAEHLRFYNSDYYISDLQPGRNTVIDADTGAVRFIDPRITLNDPQGPRTHVAKFGKRSESLPGQIL